MSKVSSSSSSKSGSSPVDDRNLLRFYQKKFEEFQKKEDKYKEKVDRHLKSLAADRHELEEEVLRRGEKISDLQKALVELQLSIFEERERFLKVSTENEDLKRNEEQLHTNIRQLLAMTHEQDLRDKIIYILKDPKVQIGFRTEFPTKSKSKDVDLHGYRKLKEELDYLKHQLNEVLKVSKSKADVVLEDCKQALEKSKTKILQDEMQIKELQKKLQELKIQEREKKTSATAISVSSATKSVSEENYSSERSSDCLSSICSSLKDIHLSLILLLKVVSKVNNLLNTIQATKLYHKRAGIPKPPSDMQILVEESTILQLESSLRQCTRLTYDINNMHKSLCKLIANRKQTFQNINALRSELKHLEEMLNVMTVVTAESDLLNVSLRRSEFFQSLRDSSIVLIDEDRKHHLENFKKIVSYTEELHGTVTRAVDFVESVIQKYNEKKNVDSIQEISSLSQRSVTRDKSAKSDSELLSLKQAKSQSLKDLEKLLGIYKRTVQEAENLGFGFSAETQLLTEKVKATEKQIQEEEELKKCDDNFNNDIMKAQSSEGQFMHSDYEEILRKINKTLSKVKQLEQGKYLKDEEMCRKLAENVNDLTKKFKELTDEFNVKSFQDQFSEYSRVTLGKLEELAKQSRNSVIAAEAQIAAHRSNAKQLSQNLKDTEELLRESVHECLSLKQKIKQTEEQHETEKYTLISHLREKLDKISNPKEVEDIIDDLTSYISVRKGTKADPFVCVYCQQGKGHKLCDERIRELVAEERKSRTELKLLMQETKQEKASLRVQRDAAEKTVADLNCKIQALQETLKISESRNTGLLEQLKLEKKRTKNMERFRRLEIEGFQTDIRNLKTKIRDLEKQLMKAVIIFEKNGKDMELLKTVHETAQRSVHATAAIRRLKAKLYELENELKSL